MDKLREYEHQIVFNLKQIGEILDKSSMQVHYLLDKEKIHRIKFCEKHLVRKADLFHYVNAM